MAKRIEMHIKARDDASAQLERVATGVDRLNGKLTSLRNITVAGVGLVQLGRYVQGSLEAFGKFETASNRLQYSLTQLGQGRQVAGMKDFARSMTEVANVSDLATMKIMAMGAQMGHLSGDALKKATVAAVGLSKAYGTDLDQSMRLVIEASRGNVDGLKRLGIEIDKNSSRHEKFNDALDAGVKHFRAARGELDTYEGKMAQLQNRLEMTRRELGERLAPALMKGADIIMEYVIPAMDNYKLIWETASATVEVEALKIRDTVSHVFEEEIPKTFKAFGQTIKDDVAGVLEKELVGMFAGLPDTVQAAIVGSIPKIQSSIKSAAGQISGAAAGVPASQPAAQVPPPAPPAVSMKGAGAPDFNLGPNYDPTGGAGFVNWQHTAHDFRRIHGYLRDNNPLAAVGVLVQGRRRSRNQTERHLGKGWGFVQQLSGDTAGIATLAAAAAMIGGMTSGAAAGGAIASFGTKAVSGWGLTAALSQAITGEPMPNSAAAGMAGAAMGVRGGMMNMASGGGFLKALFGANANTPAALLSSSQRAALFARGFLGWTAGMAGVSYGLRALGQYAVRAADNAAAHPFVPAAGELGAMNAALAGINGAMFQGVLPDQWAPDTRAAMARRDSLWGRMQTMFEDARQRKQNFLAQIQGFGDQAVPGMAGGSGMWADPVSAREFRYGGGNAGRRLASDWGQEVVRATRESVAWQQKMAQDRKARDNRLWARAMVNRVFGQDGVGVQSRSRGF